MAWDSWAGAAHARPGVLPGGGREGRAHGGLAGWRSGWVAERPVRGAVRRRAGLLAPAFRERAGVNGAIAKCC